MSWKHIHLLAEDDEDPMLSAVNLVDVFLVLVVALLTAVAAQSSADGAHIHAQDHVTIIRNPGSPQMEVIVRENGQEVKYKGAGRAGAGQGERAGVAYKLKDGHIVYVPETPLPGAAIAAPVPAATGAR